MSTENSPKPDKQNPAASESQNTAKAPMKRSSRKRSSTKKNNRFFWVLFLVSLISFIILLILLIVTDWSEQTKELVTLISAVAKAIGIGSILTQILVYFIKHRSLDATLSSFYFRSAVVVLAVLDIGLGVWLIVLNQNGTISIQVVEPTGKSAAIKLFNSNRRFIQETRNDSALFEIQPGSYYFTVSADSYETYSSDILQVGPCQRMGPFSVKLNRQQGTLTVTGTPRDVTLRITGDLTITRDIQTPYSPSLNTGKYDLEISKPEYNTVKFSNIEIKHNQEERRNFTLTRTRIRLQFIVETPSGKPIGEGVTFYDLEAHRLISGSATPIKHEYQDPFHIFSFTDRSRSYRIAAHYEKEGHFYMAVTHLFGSAQIGTLELEEVSISTLRIHCDCDGEIYVDGESQGKTSKNTSNDFYIFPGKRSIELRCNDGKTSFSKKETLMPGKIKEISF